MLRSCIERPRIALLWCLLLASFFLERPDRKQPIYIRLREGAPFAFGGLWEEWRGDERMVESFCWALRAP